MGLLDFLFSASRPAKQYGKLSVTIQGEEVKSGDERKIADFLKRNDIQYRYEPELQAGFWVFMEKVSRPDFYLPDHDLFIEYWGMVDVDDDDDRSDYIRSMKWKMRQYRELGLKFISIYPRNLNNLDWIFRKKFKEATGYDLPRPNRSPQEPHGPTKRRQ
jgi:hypothetical protein